MPLPRCRATAALLPVAISALTAISACGSSAGGGGSGAGALLVALVVPTTADPYLARTVERGADLAMRELNAKGGIDVAGTRHRLQLRTYDDGLDPQRTRSAVQSAIHDGAVGIVTDGYGSAASAADSRAAGVPEIVVADGSAELMDPAARPSLFRLGIANDAAAAILAGYVAKHAHAPAIIHDDTDNGRDGGRQMQQSLATAGEKPVAVMEVASTVPAVDAQVRAALDAHADSVVLWGTDSFVGRVVSAVHASGARLQVFTGASGESPTVRAVAGPDASDGVVFVSSRMTSEDDAVSFGQFEHRLAAAEGGAIDAGFKDREGREIRQPADAELFSYDAVNVLAAALSKAGSAEPSAKLIQAMLQSRVRSANGDARGFNPDNHEGVADDDIYVARIEDMTFAPVKDEPLSATLPTADQILADFH